jgi:outer membrane protein TolC
MPRLAQLIERSGMKMGRFSMNIMVLASALCVVLGCIGEVIAQTRMDLAGVSPVGEQVASPLKLTLSQLVELVRERNEQILSQEAEWLINKETVKRARSIFEPELVGTFQREHNRQRNTTEEKSSRQFFNDPIIIYEERNTDYSAAIEGLIPTGAKLSLGYMLHDMSNTLSERENLAFQTGDREYRTVLSASIRQPLLKDGGIKATMAKIRMAEADSEVSFQDYRQRMMEVVSKAVEAYWNLCLAQERLQLRKDSVRYTEQLLQVHRERFRTGRIAEIEVFETEAGVAERKAWASEAEQQLTSAMNNVRDLFSSSAAVDDTRIEAIDQLEMEWLEPGFQDTLYKAFRLHPVYISTRIKVDREDIQIAFYKNQRWPQLDLQASYGLNGLDSSSGGSWDAVSGEDEFKQWLIKLELRIPLGGGMKTRSELEAAKHKKRQALLDLKHIEVVLANFVDTAVRGVSSAADQVGYYVRSVESRKRLLDGELARLRAGKSDSRRVLEREVELRMAQEAVLESLVKHKMAIVKLEGAAGSLLAHYGIEAVEEEL